jgi:hypothetical protein
MKKQIFKLQSVVLILILVLTGCEKGVGPNMENDSILPDQFGVDIPDAISFDKLLSESKSVDPVNGNLIYEHLGTFIHVGNQGAKIVGDIIKGIAIYEINKPMSFSFNGDDDGRVKNLSVIEAPYFDGETWEYELTITDAESETNNDGGMALQIFWNRSPRAGTAILKPYNIDRENDSEIPDAVFRIDYSEAGDRGYDAHMLVSVSGLPVLDPLEGPYSMSTLKMFAGKTGDIVDVYGNSNHPNATFINSDAGFNWAFVASGNDALNIGVAEVGLPSSILDEPSRSVLLNTYSIKNVFTNQIYEVWPDINPESVETFLLNTTAPGFFNSKGFVQGGESPSEDYSLLATRLQSLSPYNPKEVASMSIEFSE